MGTHFHQLTPALLYVLLEQTSYLTLSPFRGCPYDTEIFDIRVSTAYEIRG